MTTLEALIAARELISDQKRWTKGEFNTHSWLNAEEIARFEEAWARAGEHSIYGGRAVPNVERDIEHNIFRSYLFGNSWAGWALYPDSRPKGVEDVRWVFWFDN